MLTQKLASRSIPVRDVLRAQTREAHDRLHEHSSFVALFHQDLRLPDYRHLTARLYGFYAPLDRAVQLSISEQDDTALWYDYVPRSKFLAQDLTDLGWQDHEIREIPLCQAAFEIVSPITLGGVLYVVEGATLGGSTIDRAAQKMLEDATPAGRRFWAWCRLQKKQRWTLMMQYLDCLSQEGHATDDLVTGARDTFRVFADWLAPLDKPHPIMRALT